MGMFAKFGRKEDPQNYADKDGHLVPVLGTREMIAMGVGTIVGAGIFTMPGIVAADYAGPAVTLSFVVAAVVAGLAALAYSEFASALPFAGSIYSWANVVFGEFWGWISGWAILAEYLIALALVASSWSAYFQGFVERIGIDIPTFMSGAYNAQAGTYFDFFGAVALILVALLVRNGVKGAARVESVLVVLKIAVILLFIVVGATAIRVNNWTPFIPAHQAGTSFGGLSGVWAGAAQVFFAYLGFDMIAANSAEAKNPQKTMPRSIVGSLGIATVLYVLVSAVLVGMFHYTQYKNNAEAAAWALAKSGHVFTANMLSIVALVGMFTGLIALMLGGSRLIYAFGRDAMVPKTLGKLDERGLPNNAVLWVTLAAIVLGSIFPVGMLANLVSSGTLIAFIFAAVGILVLRRRKDIDHSGFLMPLYPVLPLVSAGASLFLLAELNIDAKLVTLGWVIFGAIIYMLYGVRHSTKNEN